jgi:hypothetical protein
MADEATDLANTLVHTVNVIESVDAEERMRIRETYEEGLRLIVRLVPPGGPRRCGIEACLRRFREMKDGGDVACAGWMLAALLTRVEEGDLANSGDSKGLIESAVRLLEPNHPLGRDRTDGTRH